jgi:hypothetical protein
VDPKKKIKDEKEYLRESKTVSSSSGVGSR